MALKLQESTYSVHVPLIDRTFEFKYSAALVPALVLGGRLSFGWIFIWSGFDKLITDFSAEGFLVNASRGPLKDVFVDMSTSSVALDVIDPLLVWGQILIGFSLILGFFTRIGLLFAATQMFLFYLAQLYPANNPFLDFHLIYIGIFALLGAMGAGRVLGLDALVEKLEPVKRLPVLNWLLG
ncbi:MAG: DoxX family protein [Chloroflexi bacterium]|nr:DoxX family protein [Chloroflexota bacterium]